MTNTATVINVATGKIAARAHHFEPNAAAIMASRIPTAQRITQFDPSGIFSHAGAGRINITAQSHTQNAKEQAMLEQPNPFAAVFRLMTGKQL
jgi:hypothetical protein